jgi:hypothetical protein
MTELEKMSERRDLVRVRDEARAALATLGLSPLERVAVQVTLQEAEAKLAEAQPAE